uniref:Uncharacterized protein n=1 Tax=Manihot esculenta TaxID=3983 RepID=A0A2C9WBG5_MANES
MYKLMLLGTIWIPICRIELPGRPSGSTGWTLLDMEALL